MARPAALIQQYLEAGNAFTQMTRDRAEAIVKELVKAGEVRSKQAQRAVDDLVDRSRENAEQLAETVRGLVEAATKDVVARLEEQVAQLAEQVQSLLPDAVTDRMPGAAKKAAPTTTPVVPDPSAPAAPEVVPPTQPIATKKAATKKKAPTKAAAKKAPAKRSAAKKA